MTTRQVAFRLKSEGKTEVLRDARDVGEAFKGSYQAAEQGAAAASSAADRLEQKYRRMAQAAQDAAQAQAEQARINAAIGVREPTRGAAAASASVFMQDDDDVRRVEALRASIDPLTAAQNKLNHELREYQTLANAGKITTGELAQLQTQAKTRFDETTAAIKRNEQGLTRLALASRLNLGRQGADVLVTAAMGMNPAMIAIQQGPQILDALATSGIKATAGLIAVGGALTATAAGVVVMAAAWQRANSAAAELEDATTGVGRTAGLTADQLRALTVVSAAAGEVSRKAARDMAVEYLATGRIGAQVLGDLIATTKDYASFTGQDAAAATKDLAKAMLDPTKAGEAMTAQFGLLSLEQLDNIENMQKQGDLLGAQKVLLDELTSAVSGHAARAGEITDAWSAIGRSISDALDKLGEFLYATEDERIDNLRDLLASRSLNPSDRRRFEGELWVAERQQGIRALLDEGVADEAQRNQTALRERQAREAREREGRAAANRAAAAARREAAEAERARREALQRERQEEDRAAQIALEQARGRGDDSRVRALEDANAVRVRERQLIDAGTTAEAARTKALKEQQQLIDARSLAQAREVRQQARAREVEVMRLLGEDRYADNVERRLNLTRRINELEKQGLDNGTAKTLAGKEALELEEARAVVAERSAAVREREWKTVLAQASGDRSALRDLNRETWIANRAREIEGDKTKPLNFGEGVEQATREYGELMRAQTVGAFREGLGSLISDIRSGGIRDALANQFERASDRLFDKLIEGLSKIDFGGGGDGNWLSKGLNFLFGRNADGTDYWPGGPTWVGERGPELLDLPRGSRVIENARSLDMMRKAASGGGGMTVVVQATYAPANTISGVDTERLEAMMAQDRAEFESRTIAAVNDGIARRLITS